MDAPHQCHRVVAFFDVDCFYAQAEILRRPHLQDRPVGVTQKSLVVTCNYVARKLGVPKMASIVEAKLRCPDLVLFNGEDLTPYRAASKHIMAVLSRFGVLERRGLDEAALDITSEVLKRCTSMPCKEFSGHVIGTEENCGDSLESRNNQGINKRSCDYYIMLGSQVAMQIRVAVEKETGFKCSCGIASNKMLAKMVSSVNKPNQQTCLLDSAVSAFLKPLHICKLPGVGHQTECALREIGVTTVADLQQITMQELSSRLGNRIGRMLYENCRGVDNSLVQSKGPLKSLSVEDSFHSCCSFNQAEDILRRLAPDLISRLDEDKEEYSRRPKSLTVKWRFSGNRAFKSASALMPLEVLSVSVDRGKRAGIVAVIAVKLLMKEFGRHPFSLVLLNIGATNFVPIFPGSSGASHDIRSFLGKPEKQASKVVSKREARAFREECEGVKDGIGHLPSAENGKEGCGLGLKEDEYGDNCMRSLFHGCSSSEESMRFDGEYLVPRTTMAEPEATGSSGTKSDAGRRSCIKITEGIKINGISNADMLGERAIPKRGVAEEEMIGNEAWEALICQICGNEVVGDPRSQQEHEDYHLALELDSHEHELCMSVASKQEHDDYHLALNLSSQEQLMPANLFDKSSLYHGKCKHKVKKALLSNKSAIRRKSIQTSTLDCFINMQK